MFKVTQLTLLSRILAAILGGYLVAMTSSYAVVAFGQWLGLSRDDATYLGMMLSFIFYVGAIIWSFTKLSVTKVWRDLIALSALFYLIFTIDQLMRTS